MKLKNKLLSRLFSEKSQINYNIQKIFIAFTFIINFTSVEAQENQYSRPNWFFGVAGGANLNFYRGTTQQLTNDLTVLSPFNNGYGTG